MKYKTQLLIAITLTQLIFTGTVFASYFYVGDDRYIRSDLTIDCKCNVIDQGEHDPTILPDYSQDGNSQAIAWAIFCEDYPGIDFYNDFVNKRTKTYNCHSYVYHNSTSWIPTPLGWYTLDTANASDCWIHESYAPSGSTLTIYSNSTHSCYIADQLGKCGKNFLCKNNSTVYGENFPTDKYAKL